MPAQHPTSLDVARAARVSQTTVSAVLRGRQGNVRISAATRQRVLDAAAALNYIPNAEAQALRRRRSGILAFVSSLRWQSPLDQPVPVLLSIYGRRAALQRGLRVLMYDGAADDPHKLLAVLRQQRAEGILLHSPDSAEQARVLAASGLPVVQLMRPQHAVATAIVTHEYAAAVHTAVDYLVAQGHTRIGFLGVTSPHPFDQQRELFFRAALARHQLPLPESYRQRAEGYSRTNGLALTARLLAMPTPPTALFAASDTLAHGAMLALYERGIRVPDALTLVGFGAGAALNFVPPIPAVTLPLADLAESAVAVLVAQLDNPDQATEHVSLAAQFVVPEPLAGASEQYGAE